MSDSLASIYTHLQILKKNDKIIRSLDSVKKNAVLTTVAKKLISSAKEILELNKKDLESLSKDQSTAFVDRLTLTEKRIEAMAESLNSVVSLTDPVGERLELREIQKDLFAEKIRAPLGTILMIFESRPNVITEAFSLAFKSGNSIILRGGSDSKHTASAIYKIIHEALSEHALSDVGFFPIQDYNRDIVLQLLRRKDLVDIVIPRGGEKLIDFVQQNALMPIIKNDRGMCHTYVDQQADLDKALAIIENAKTQRPGVCNALETILIHTTVAQQLIPQLYEKMSDKKLQWRVDDPTLSILSGKNLVVKASEQDWDTEHLDLIINCRIVNSIEQALEHIEQHGSKHSECIITENAALANLFMNSVDAAAVYWNASTRFTDGYQFGLGGEIGISTQKLHVRGPVGLRELTTPRWKIQAKSFAIRS